MKTLLTLLLASALLGSSALAQSETPVTVRESLGEFLLSIVTARVLKRNGDSPLPRPPRPTYITARTSD